MSSTDYNYDTEGQFFPYFVLTITGIIIIPLTYATFKPSKELENTAPRIRTEYKPAEQDLIIDQKKKQKRRERKLKRIVFSASGWLLMGYMAYLMAVTTRTQLKIWDPYEVLGVSRSADEKSIKRHFRKLSLTQHPDKVKIDGAKNQTIESVNEHWVEITKAFKALTDEEIRRNFLEYGHPDGKQSFSMGIALPQFLIDGGGKYTLIFYLGLLGIFLPYVAGKWWYGTQKMTKERILVNSAGNLVRAFEDDMIEGGVITALSHGEEYESIIGVDRAETGLSKVEKLVTEPGKYWKLAAALKPKDKKMLDEISDPARRKVLSLLWAYLGRIDLGSEELNQEKLAVAPIAWQLNDAYQTIIQAFSITRPLIASYRTSQCLIQAIPPDGPPLLQLPFFTPEVVESIESGRVRNHYTVQDYMEIDEDVRKAITVRPGFLTEQQYQIAMSTAAQLPFMSLEKFWFKVEGEKVVTPNSLVQLVIKFRFLAPGVLDFPAVKVADLEDVDGDDEKDDKEKFVPPLAHAPYFARDHSPKWHIFLGQPKNSRIAVPPSTYTTFSKPILTEDGEPTYNVQTMRMTFGAPPDVGEYTFAMHILNDSYLGFDLTEYITLNVEDPSNAEVIEDDGEISEPGEDSIAGQMKALRSGIPLVDSDESDTEGEAGDGDTSDTNTDTDEE